MGWLSQGFQLRGWGWGWVFTAFAVAGIGNLPARAQTSSAASGPVTVSGRVLDGTQGSPIARALVRLNGRAVLTDAQGHFSFPGFTGARAFAVASKPGYAAASDTADGQFYAGLADPSVPTDLLLYPNGLLFGTVTGPDGQPLAGAALQVSRANYDANGLSALQVRYTVTNAEGEYRFRAAAGAYRLSLRYISSVAETGQAVLPQDSPGGSPSEAAGYWSLRSGQERRVDLRAEGGLPVAVTLRVSGAAAEERHRGLRVLVRTQSGASLNTAATAEDDDGQYQVMLPPGGYRLEVFAGGAIGRDDALEGSGRVTVTRRGSAGTDIRLAPFTSIPLEIVTVAAASASGASGASSQPPAVPQLNLNLHALESNGGFAVDLRPQERPGGGYEFRVPPGRYRLSGAESGGSWTVTSAGYGAANLLGDELVVASGSAGTPIRLAVSNIAGQVTANINLGTAAGAWMYVLPDVPSLVPEMINRVGTAGSLTRSLAPGSYVLLAVSTRLQADFRDAKVIARLRSAGSAVSVTDGGKVSVTLVLHSTGELLP